jgi:DNA-binding CsgD family transcriptional regulator
MPQRAWALVGRDEEVNFIVRALEAGTPGGVVLSGSAGVGKTRLGREVVDRAASGGLATEWVVATTALRPLPFGALSPVLPAFGTAASAAGLLNTARLAITSKAPDGRLLLAVDDAHLLDDMSAGLLLQLATRSSVFLVLSVRAGDPAPDPLVSLWKDGLAARLEVRALSRPATEELVGVALGGPVDGWTARHLFEMSHGNPQLLRELLTLATESGTLRREGGRWRWWGAVQPGRRLRELVETRIADLDADQRAVLDTLAIGEPLEFAVLETLAEQAALAELEQRGLVVIEQEGIAVRARLDHPLYGDVLRATMPEATARGVRRSLARTVTSLERPDGDELLRVAAWRLDAGDASETDQLLRASEQAWRRFDGHLAERFAQAAQAAGCGAPADLALANALFVQNRFEDALATVAATAGRLEDDETKVNAALLHANLLLWGFGRPDEAEAVLAAAVDSIADPNHRDEVRAEQSWVPLYRGLPDRILELANPVVTREDAPASAKVRALAPVVVALAMTGRTATAVRAAEDGAATAMSLSDRFPTVLGSLLAATCYALGLDGGVTDAEQLARGLYEQGAADWSDGGRGLFGFAMGKAALERGHVHTAVATLGDAIACLQRDDIAQLLPWATACLARALALTGDVDAAQRVDAEARQRRPPLLDLYQAEYHLTATWLAAARGEHTIARELAAAAATEARTRGQHAHEALHLHDLARLGEPRCAAEPLASLARRADGRLIPLLARNAEALASDDASELDDIARQFEGCGYDLFAAETAAWASAAFRRAGRAASALGARERAVASRRRCGAVRTPGTQLIDDTPGVFDRLTGREREVIALVARGLTNRQIAARLHVSERTVDSHVHHAFTKLGLHHREELAHIVG